jgi:hypothetical protein
MFPEEVAETPPIICRRRPPPDPADAAALLNDRFRPKAVIRMQSGWNRITLIAEQLEAGVRDDRIVHRASPAFDPAKRFGVRNVRQRTVFRSMGMTAPGRKRSFEEGGTAPIYINMI